MEPKYYKKDEFTIASITGSPIFGLFIPISGVILFILIIFIYSNYHDIKSQNKILNNKKTFCYIDKKTNDTIKYYGYTDLDSAIFHARNEKKEILLIFSGHACMSEGGKEWKTLSLFGDNDKIQDNFIIAWLAVDDIKPAKDTNKVVFWYGKERRLVKLGDHYKYFEEVTFNQSTQPLFCFIDTLKKPFGKVLGYTNNKKEVENFVYSGLVIH